MRSAAQVRLHFGPAARTIVLVAVALLLHPSRVTTTATAAAADAAAAAFARGGRVVVTRTTQQQRRHACAASTSPFPCLRPPRRPLLRSLTAAAEEGLAGEEDDLLKWERMYYQSETLRSSFSGLSSDEVGRRSTRTISQVRVVSFDLDNTVWRTSPTIASANDALSQFLQKQHSVPSTVRVERIMNDLFHDDPGKYNPAFAAADGASAAADSGAPLQKKATPVLLTRLRKDAIRVALESHAEVPPSGSRDEVSLAASIDEAFDHWVEARHDAIVRHMADDVASCLSNIAKMRTAEGHPVLIGAITDGNSDPSLVEALEPFFDFCVNAERVGVAKPDKRLYLEAVTIASSHPGVNSAVAATTDRMDAEEMVGPWWVHIGDDFIKDVVASKSLGMRSVWCRELVKSSSTGAGSEAMITPGDAKKETSARSVEDLVKQVSEMKVVRMEVGAEDYLASSLHDEFADAVIDRFSEVSTLLHEWHKAGLDSHVASDEPAEDVTFVGSRQSLDDATFLEVPDPALAEASTEKKFCIHCGTKLPAVAVYCSGCGQKQI